MTNEEKAKEIYKDNLYDCEVRGVVQDEQEILFMLEKMAKWKEEQLIEKACKWLNDWFTDDTCKCGIPITKTAREDFFNDFKKAMMEE